MIKKVLTSLAAAAICFAAQAQLTPGEKSLGPKLGYVSENSSCVAGLVFQYNFTSHLRLVPEISCVFRNKGQDALLIDLNAHVPFGVGSQKAWLYPLAGLSFNSWATHGIETLNDDDVTTHTNRFGVNVGAGFELRCSDSMKLNLEAKYTLIKSYSATYVTAGISYIF